LNREVAKQFAKLFIARSDVKAVQRPSGEYSPVVDRDSSGKVTKTHPFTMPDLLEHIDGKRTYGHYFLNTENQCKLFAFDIDLDELKLDVPNPNQMLMLPRTQCEAGVWSDFVWTDPRAVWVPARNYLKFQMKMLAHGLAHTIQTEFEMQTAVTYTGAKGIHVYGFTGLMPATEVRAGAEYVIEKVGRFRQHLGSNFFKHEVVLGGSGYEPGEVNHEHSFQCFTIEVFPKQTEIKEGGYGNLMRLPLGKNLKNPQDLTFFVDLRTELTALRPRDPMEALTVKDQWL
jgi:hypothetical protein